MSYCVNCGVELDATAKACALCNTPVYNPNQLPKEGISTPYPKEEGQVETVKSKDMAILLTVVFLATAVTCGLLNRFVFTGTRWSLAVIGICVVLWVIMLPGWMKNRPSVYLCLVLDGAAVFGYLYLLGHMVKDTEWVFKIGCPISVLVTCVAEGVALAMKKLPRSFLTFSLYLIMGVAFLCTGLEMIIDYYLKRKIVLGWSAVVLTVCVIVGIAVITMLSRKRIRNAVRRRFHF